MAVHLAVDPRNRPPPSAVDLATIFKSDTVSGSRVFGGAALTWTDFAVHEDGFGRILVRDISLDHFEVGRLVQRLLEIETYRMMALLPSRWSESTTHRSVQLKKRPPRSLEA